MQIVSVTSFFEDGTLTMYVVPGGREIDITGFGVFGVHPDSLEEYVPSESEMKRMIYFYKNPASSGTVRIHEA